MESGLDGRNNSPDATAFANERLVSMESGLDGRNNVPLEGTLMSPISKVSMESGLDGRNNLGIAMKEAP